MRRAAVDLLGERSAQAAVDALISQHSDRIAILEDAWDSRATACLVPALPPGARSDPDLERVAIELLGCPASQLPVVSAWRPAQGGQPARMVSASHSWAAVAVARVARDDRQPIGLLHVDAHDDLACPPPGRSINVRDPAAVMNCVLAGRVGIGSFISPFVAAGVIGAVHHVTRAALRSSPPDWAHLLTWVDIDLDCLCNAFDDQGGESPIDEYELEGRVQALTKYVCEALPTPPRLLTLALSPGFFPAALWRPGLTMLQDLLARQWPRVRLPFVSP